MYVEILTQQLHEKPTDLLWMSFARNFRMIVHECIEESDFWRFIVTSTYPHLLAIFKELFARIALLTDESSVPTGYEDWPKSVLSLLGELEQSYLRTVTQELGERRQFVHTLLSSPSSAADTPALTHALMRIVTTESSACATDERLASRVAETLSSAINAMFVDLSTQISRDDLAYTLQKPQPPRQQLQNAAVMAVLIAFLQDLRAHSDSLHAHVSEQALEWERTASRILHQDLMDPLCRSVQAELVSVLARMSRFKLEKARAAPGAHPNKAPVSTYMLELHARLTSLRNGVLNRITVLDEVKTAVKDLVQFVLRAFLLFVTLIRLHEEDEKVQIVRDISMLETSLQQLLSCISTPNETTYTLEDCGGAFTFLQNFRNIMFLPSDKLHNPAVAMQAFAMPLFLWAQHLFSRSATFPLANEQCRKNKLEYAEWLLDLGVPHSLDYANEATNVVSFTLYEWIRAHEQHPRPQDDPADRDTLQVLLAWKDIFAGSHAKK